MNAAIAQRAYWDRGVDLVPHMTGAAGLLDGRDFADIATAVELACPLGKVLDVGCGTGRLSRFCAEYLGVDIAPSAVEYCAKRGIPARVIDGPADLAAFGGFDLVLCMSVFTHVDRAMRREYLATFARLSPELLVDIIAGDGSGTIAAWSADPHVFRRDLADAGYAVVASTQWSWNGFTHEYFRARRPS